MSTSDDLAAKTAHLLSKIDLDRPELAGVRAAADPAGALLERLQVPPRARFFVEYERKTELLAFLRETYPAWQAYDTREADRHVAMTIADAQGPRALGGISALGRAWWATGDPSYGAAFQRFYLAVPTGEMFTWGDFNGSQGAIELNAYFLLLDCPGFTRDGRIAFLDHLIAITDYAWDNATSLWDQTGMGPEGHNWYLHGMHVLPYVGFCFPEFTRSAFFLRTGWGVLEEHLRGHYRADGGARETTPGYQQGSLHSLWQQYILARRNGYPVSADFADRLLNATRFLLRLMTPDGSVPAIGDSGHTPGGLTGLAAIAAAVTGDRECKWYAEYCRGLRGLTTPEPPGTLPEAAFWTVGLEGALAYQAVRPRDPGQVSVLMGDTGYAALRDGDTPDARYLSVAAADRGPIVTSHGHNDIFSLELFAGGTRFLGQPAIAPYGTSKGRDYDESSACHSVLTVDGMEQATIVNEWRWSQVTIPAVRRWISEPTHDFFHGIHEGFYRWPEHMVLHGRKIFFVKAEPAYWVVLDWLESNVEVDAAVTFSGCRPGEVHGSEIRLRDASGMLAILPPAEDGLTPERVDSAGFLAYCAEIKQDPAKIPAFVYRTRTGPTCLAWALVPLASGAEPPAVRRLPVTVNGQPAAPAAAAALELRFPGHTDVLCVSHKDFDADLTFGDHAAWGFLAFRRLRADGSTALNIEHEMADGRCGR